MKIPLGPYVVGIDNTSDEGELPNGAVADAVNVNFGSTGGVERRSGRSLAMASDRVHSLWTAPDGRSFGVHNGELSRFAWDGSSLVRSGLRQLAHDVACSFDDVNGSLVCSTEQELLEILPDDSVRPLSLPRPGEPAAAPSASGGLSAGRYMVAVALLRGQEEGALSMAAFVDVPEGGGITVSTPTASDATLARVYRSGANGTDLFRAADLPLSGSYLVGAGQLGRGPDNQYLEQMPGGRIVRHWRGLLLVARGHNLIWSEPMRYGMWDPRHNFVQFPKRITLMEPVEGGVFVGTADGVVFLAGPSPKEWTMKRTGALEPVPYTGMAFESSLLSGDFAGDTKVAAWLARNGIVIGTADGTVREVHAKRIRLPESQTAAGVGAAVVHDRQFIATIN